ncbi:MAG: MBL fold metallo-hydrolase [Anaerolineaceae bacterium]|nr:MBL fold metallo-hydrolase [Anaerolineaceae bacterium]
MEITWYGHSCFRFMERGMASVVTDPYDNDEVGFKPLKLKADIVTSSHNVPGHNFLSAVKNDPYVINGPGEYEIGGVFITAIQTNGGSKSTDEIRNILCVFSFKGFNIVHLGALKKVPSQAQVDALGSVNVALVPIGGGEGLSPSKAAEAISLLEPNFVIPMHYATEEKNIELESLNKFLKEMGTPDIQSEDTLKVNIQSPLPEDSRVVVLNNS